MKTRIDLGKAWPEAKNALFALDALVADSGLDHTLLELIKIRASQLNQCAFCLDMHTKDARAAGETEQRIYALNAWRDTPFYTDEERAVLALTEEITLIADEGVSDEAWDEAAKHFDEATLGRIVTAIIAINAWNRLGITQRRPVGGYKAKAPAAVG
ncbi:carboxymuconolactone decarboxylase family protein [Amycolatopsis nigrescens]|uniref:carboxymuconolactone decarboxylase family protein n=1 Tax=Amycolatopsis nigrescens TaxID=381445 RepID=UPI00058D74C0|nr:carboxymuconolactone decarboxylase family protein [Amycolatopsis nigrescens]